MKQFDLLIKKKGGTWDPARAPFIQVSNRPHLTLVGLTLPTLVIS